MTNIAIVTTHPFNYSTGTAVRIKEISYELSKKGNIIYILNPFERNHILKENIFVRNIPNLPFKLGLGETFYNINRKFFANKNLANLLLNRTYIEKSSEILSKNILPILREYDIEIVQAEAEIAALACIRFNKSYKTISVFHNIWAEELVASNVIEYDSNIYRTIKEFEKKIVCDSYCSIVVSEALKSFLTKNYDIENNLLKVIYNGGRKDVAKDCYSKKPNKITYSGMLDYRQNVRLFVEAIPLIKRQKISTEIYLSNKGDEKGEIIKLIKQRKIPVNFTWFDTDTDYYNFVKSCDIGILTSSRDVPRQLGLPSKLFNYMAAGIPVVANEIGGWTDIIEENKIGLIAENNPRDFAEKIIELLSDPDRIEKMGRNATEIIKTKFNWEKSAELYTEIYKS